MEAAPSQLNSIQFPSSPFFLLPDCYCSIERQTLQSHCCFQIDDLKHCPFAEICWYFTNSWEQFRIVGQVDVIDGTNSDPVKLQQREKAWLACSLKSRMQYLAPAPRYLAPAPRLPFASEQQPTEIPTLDPSVGPVGVFCLLVLDPDQVDYLNLKSNERLIFTAGQNGNGKTHWSVEKVNP